MAVCKVLAGFAMALGVAVLASVANAAPQCGRKACSDEVAASGLSDDASRACLKQVVSDCRAGLCSCTGGSPPCSCVCGDGLCGPSEDCSTCSQDCCRAPTSTTTSTTTTTQPACQNAIPDTCGGTCPPGSICVVFAGDPRTCRCAPDGSQPCGESAFPYCNGTCPAGEQCGRTAPADIIFGTCACVPVGGPACGDATYPTCAGGCPSSEPCVPVKTSDGGTFCTCSPDSPCSAQCFSGGVCPTGMVCLLNLSGPCGCVAP